MITKPYIIRAFSKLKCSLEQCLSFVYSIAILFEWIVYGDVDHIVRLHSFVNIKYEIILMFCFHLFLIILTLIPLLINC